MVNKELHAGYLIDSLRVLFKDDSALQSCWEEISAFSLDSDFDDASATNPIFAVLVNLISRGRPTRPSLRIEEELSTQFSFAKPDPPDKTGALRFTKPIIDVNLKELFERSFLLIDPRLNRNHRFLEEFGRDIGFPGSTAELDFAYRILPNKFGDFICQLLEPQADVEHILSNSRFIKQRFDFFLANPTPKDKPVSGIIIEIDGRQHHDRLAQKKNDGERDSAAEIFGIPTIRVKAEALPDVSDSLLIPIRQFTDTPWGKKFRLNYESPLYSTKEGLTALQLALTPFAIARIQRSLAEALLSGALTLNDKAWRIVVIERDVPCARIALADFTEILTNLLRLQGSSAPPPRIDLHVLRTSEFAGTPLAASDDKTDPREFAPPNKPDLLIDISVLQRRGFTRPDEALVRKLAPRRWAIIRSVHRPIRPKRIQFGKRINYPIGPEGSKELDYFLRNIFRKSAFRDGQIPILRAILAGRNAIALLPTGAGKSVTYQMAAMLQPGTTIVVDPLKSLMRDQHENLMAAGIDSLAVINSDITAAEREKAQADLKNGFIQFLFVSPERFQIEEFRKTLKGISDPSRTHSSGGAPPRIAYCVVDEAHCVSEWGHDFRTAYLRIGANIRKFCSSDSAPPIIALTGTASYDVLEDVKRELDLQRDVEVITPSRYKRDELKFAIKKVAGDSTTDRKGAASAKIQALLNELRAIPKRFKENLDFESFIRAESESPRAGIIFCPHVGGPFGVKSVEAEIRNALPLLQDAIAHFAGSSGAVPTNSPINYSEVQSRFKADQVRLLTATKAFGMGIDKPNIRFSVHFSMPASIESFYQEAGRAGRDRDTAYCLLLYSAGDKQFMLSFHENAFRGIEHERRVLRELLDEIRLPPATNLSKLNTAVQERWPGITLNLWAKKPFLYANDNNHNAIGYIDLSSGRISPKRAPTPDLNPTEVLNFALDRLKTATPKGISLHKSLTTPPVAQVQAGIESHIKSLSLGESGTLVIGFENDSVMEIARVLSASAPHLTPEAIRRAFSYCSSSTDFMENLERAHWKATNLDLRLPADNYESIRQLYKSARLREDTFKAVYRLLVIGAIDDYEVDYNAEIIRLTIKRKSAADYKKHLNDYLSRYLSAEDTIQTIARFRPGKEESPLRPALEILLEFVYSKIAAKRRQAIDVMESAILTGLAGGDFEEYVHTYFDSKFTPELRPHTHEYDFNLVFRYINATAGEPDSMNHLRGACDRLLVENPDNGAFLLMRSYCRLLLPHHDPNDAIRDLLAGLDRVQKRFHWGRAETARFLTSFIRDCVLRDANAGKHLEPVLALSHIDWVKEFNLRLSEGTKS